MIQTLTIIVALLLALVATPFVYATVYQFARAHDCSNSDARSLAGVYLLMACAGIVAGLATHFSTPHTSTALAALTIAIMPNAVALTPLLFFEPGKSVFRALLKAGKATGQYLGPHPKRGNSN